MTWADRLTSLPLGTRVVVRYLIESGATDALGELTALDADRCTVTTRRGDVVIPVASIIAAKPVPPAPIRRLRPAPTD
ncbi:MAG: ferrous iron transport protein A [Nakamurella sp.]